MKHEIKSCYVEVVSYLQEHLPRVSSYLRDCRVLNPDFKDNFGGQATFGRLAYKMSNVLKDTGMYVNPASQFADEIKRQFLLYQSVNISFEPTKYIENYWTTVSSFVDTDGHCCMFELATLAIDYLCVSHGNVTERGLSINKQLLQDRSQLQERTIEVLRFVKESI